MKASYIIAALLIVLGNSTACEQGSVTNSQGICIFPNYIEGCSDYLNEAQCKTCNYRYELLSSGLCSLNTSPNEDCCRVRDSKGGCTTCQTGLYLIDGKCQESNILGCLEKNNAGVCTNCAQGFYLQDGKCRQVIRNCRAYTDNSKTTCSDCAKDYSLINNLCVKNSILGCMTEEDKTCKECYKPYVLNNGNCQISNCQTYDEYKCVACECGYYLNENGQCNKMEIGCVRYRRGVCADCLPRFRLKGSACEIEGCTKLKGLQCSQCEEGYKLVNGGCKMNNCISWKDGSCQICQSGFHYKQGKCVPSNLIKTE